MASGSGTDVDPEREVNRLHLMLEDWYADVRPDIDPIITALADDFTTIGPDGRLREREAAVASWEDRQASYVDSTPAVAVELEDIGVERSLYGVHQVTFGKRVRVDGEWTIYACSLWLRETDSVPSGLQWLHLTESEVTVEDA